MKRRAKKTGPPLRPTDDEVRAALRMTEGYWAGLDGIDREYLRGVATRELRRAAAKAGRR